MGKETISPVSDRQRLTITGMWPQYITKKKPHRGIDFAADLGEQINAFCAGTIVTTKTGKYKVLGASHVTMLVDDLFIISKHTRPYPFINGELIIGGTGLGKADNSGSWGGPHLHLEMRYAKSGRRLKQGVDVDPLPILAGMQPGLTFTLLSGKWKNKKTGKMTSMLQMYEQFNPTALKYITVI